MHRSSTVIDFLNGADRGRQTGVAITLRPCTSYRYPFTG
jgi:hypothetical protein